jgi:hypothetical protein
VLFKIILLLLKPTNWNTTNKNSQPFVVNSSFCLARYRYTCASGQIKLHTLDKRKYHLDTMFLSQVYLCSKFYPSLSETVNLRASAPYVREYSNFNICSRSKICIYIARTSAVGMLTFMEPNFIPSVVIYTIKILIALKTCICMFLLTVTRMSWPLLIQLLLSKMAYVAWFCLSVHKFRFHFLFASVTL